ncbi:MAG: PKD domain-containing protein [Deltaproteobacteria bacterium]|nr:PKD domain-containing protein [Deltaproteobacteria bacterium]
MRYLAVLVSLFPSLATAQDLVVDATTTNIHSNQTYDSVTVRNSGTLVVNAILTVNGDMTIENTGKVTHDQGQVGMRLDVNGTLDVQPGGSIDVSSKGLFAEQTFDPINLIVIEAPTNYAGGSHGGRGGNGVAPYGDERNPNFLGGGGGNGSCSSRGGNGGGRIIIHASTLIVDGSVRANGDGPAGSACGAVGGGGAGGAINISADLFQGAGVISANGGASGSGGGGGGRIALAVQTLSFSGAIGAAGGTGSPAGGLGSAFVLEGGQLLHVAAGVASITGGDSFQSVSVGAGGVLYLNGAAQVVQQVLVPSGATVVLNDAAALTSMALSTSIAGRLEVAVPFVWGQSMTVLGELAANDLLSVDGDLTVEPGGKVTHDQGDDDAALSVTGVVWVKPGAVIDLNARGLRNGYYYNPVDYSIVSRTPDYTGGSYGGRGGGSATGVYGDALDPHHLGSGGGNGSCSSRGGNGGGRMAIAASTLRVDGTVRADGEAAAAGGCGNAGGGGAGGAIRVDVATLTGSGMISAKGGSGYAGGSGGRIALYYTSNDFSGALSLVGGSGTLAGEDGSLHSESAGGDIIVEGGIFSLTDGDSYRSIELRPGGTVDINGAGAVVNTVIVSSGGTIRLNAANSLSQLTIDPDIAGTLVINAPTTFSSLTVGGKLVVNEALAVTGDLTVVGNGRVTHDLGATSFDIEVGQTLEVQAAGLIDVSGRGLRPGPIAGYGDNGACIDPYTLATVSGSGPYNGASYGGLGGQYSGSAAVNAPYGDAAAPDHLGSGGGEGSCSSRGGHGGGRISIRAFTLTLNGLLLADGTNADPGGCGADGGGGSGGSILVSVTALGGTGTIAARGGRGAGGGSGGRVRIDYQTSGFSGAVLVTGGSGSAPGASGTVELIDSDSGILHVVGGIYVLTSGDSYQSVLLGPQGVLDIQGAANVAEPIVVPVGSKVILSSSTALVGLSIDPAIAGTLQIEADTVFPETLVINGTLVVNRRFQVPALTAVNGSRITHTAGVNSMNLVVEGTLDLQQGASVDAAGLGYRAGPNAGFGDNGATLDPVTLTKVSGSGRYNGGCHAGAGGLADGAYALAATYDDVADPRYHGGGGGEGSCNSRGGNGGGLIRISAAVLAHNGQITANGLNPDPGGCGGQGGGGAGGSVVLSLGTWTGAGVLLARGGSSDRGGGAGGLINVSYASKSHTGSVDFSGGSGSAAGSDGSIAETAANEAPAITSTPPTVAVAGDLFVYQPTVTGSPTLIWRLISGPLQAQIDSATGALTWTPTSEGVTSFVIEVRNYVGSVQQTFSVTVHARPSITTSAATGGVVGQPYHYSADDRACASGTPPFAWSVVTAPTGFSIDPDSGVVSWTPDSEGTFSVCIRVANAVGDAQQCFSVTVVPASSATPPTITSTAGTAATVGTAFVYDGDNRAEASGTSPITWSVAVAPTGFEIDAASGLVTWTPSQAGEVNICIRATNDFGNDMQCFTVAVSEPVGVPPTITSAPATSATVGAAYHYDADDQIEATGDAPISFSVITGPGELTVDASSGLVQWTPSSEGDVDVTLRATNAYGYDEQSFTVAVAPDVSGAPHIAHTASPVATVNRFYVYDEDGSASASGATPIVWSKVAGPAELQIEPANGVVTWLPSAAGSVDVTLAAANSHGRDEYTFTVVVSESAGPDPTAVATITPSEGNAPLQVTADGSQSYAAPGRSISYYRWNFGDGTPLGYGPTATHTYQMAGSYVARLRVIDSAGAFSDRALVITVLAEGQRPPTARILVTQVEGAESLTVDFSCNCSQGTAPIEAFLWDFGDGTRSEASQVTHTFGAGSYEVRLTVVDAAGLTASDSVVIRVTGDGNEPPYLVAQGLPLVGPAPLAVDFLATYGDSDGNVVAVAWDFGDGEGSAEVAVAHTFQMAGAYHVVVKATDDQGLTASAALDIEVSDAAGGHPPQILSIPATRVEAETAYHYDSDDTPAARGDRPLTWSLGKKVGDQIVGAPDGMNVDAATGRIAWTPTRQQIGKVEVVLVARNAAGAVAQEWEIEVGGEPLASEPGGCSCRAPAGGLGATTWLALLALALARGWRGRQRRAR